MKEGVPFRDAYRKVAAELDQVQVRDPRANIRARTHLGGTGNLGLDLSEERIGQEAQWVEASRAAWARKVQALIGRW